MPGYRGAAKKIHLACKVGIVSDARQLRVLAAFRLQRLVWDERIHSENNHAHRNHSPKIRSFRFRIGRSIASLSPCRERLKSMANLKSYHGRKWAGAAA